jgi:hypothetical protein
MTILEWLDSPCAGHYCDGSWRDWFADVLTDLFKEGESFSGKRPGHNDSDWEYILAHSLVDAGLLKGTKTFNENWGQDEYDFEWSDYTAVMVDVVRFLVSA